MPDQPRPAIITLKLRDPGDALEFIGLSTFLHQQGLILEEPRELMASPRNSALLYLICVFVDGFAAENWVQEDIPFPDGSTLSGKLICAPRQVMYRGVGFEFSKRNQSCSCSSPSLLLLVGRTIGYMGALRCGDCQCVIPNYKLPEELPVESWARTYSYVWNIWLESDLHEDWAAEQLEGVTSQLNNRGRELAQSIGHYFGVPVYYYLATSEQVEVCPICFQTGERSAWSWSNVKCASCRVTYKAHGEHSCDKGP